MVLEFGDLLLAEIVLFAFRTLFGNLPQAVGGDTCFRGEDVAETPLSGCEALDQCFLAGAEAGSGE